MPTNNHNESISKRGNVLAANPARIDFELFMEAMENQYCPENNQDGAFALNVAENELMASSIKEKLTLIVQENELADWVLKYTGTLGHQEVRMAIADFMEKYLCKCPIDPETIGLSAGAAATIEVSSFVLADAKDVVVIPAPSYPMYTNDLGIKSGIERYDLQTHHNIEEIAHEAPLKINHLDSALADLNDQGRRFRILLLTSPDNPTGCRYTKDQLLEFAHWCIDHKIHMIVNEIYGLSILTEEKDLENEFEDDISFAQIMASLKSDYLHMWYAFSKDFAMSGLRIGFVHSLNQAFMTGLSNANVPNMVSNYTQWLVGEMLKDDDFLGDYIIENRKRLRKSYHLVVENLESFNIPYIPSKGSFFIWVDLSKFLKDDSEEGQEQLWLDIYRNSGVLLTPGIGFMHTKKGLFRIVFTSVSFDYLKVAMKRLSAYLMERSKPFK